MKKIIVLLSMMLLCGLSANAQSSLSYKDSASVYEGTWRYENPTTHEVFTIQLKRVIGSNGPSRIMIYGSYCYTKNSNVILDALDKMKGKCYNQLEWEQLGWRERMSFPVQMYGGYAKNLNLDFSDLTYKKFEGGGYVQLLSTKAGDEKLLWYPQNSEGVILDIVGEPEEPDGFSVPVNVVMTKVH
jgi:hypothetical protein